MSQTETTKAVAADNLQMCLGLLMSSPSLRRRCLTTVRARHRFPGCSGPAPLPGKRPVWSVIQQTVPHGPDHDLLLRAKTQLHLNGVDGVSDCNRLDFPCLRNRSV